MGRRPLLGAYVEPIVAVWIMRHVTGRTANQYGLRECDVAEAIRHFRSTGQGEVAWAIERTFAQLREAERQWEQRRREDAASVDGSAETGSEPDEPRSERAEGHPAKAQAVVDSSAAAGLLGVTERRVRQMLVDGLLDGQNVGRQWLIDEASITALQVNRRLAG